MTFAKRWLTEPAVLAGIAFAGSVVLAKLVDWLVSKVLRRLARRTKTEVDEKLIDALHRPIFVTVVLLGIHAAVLILGPEATVIDLENSIVQTVAIAVWTVAALRIVSALLYGMTGLSRRVSWLEERTLPLFDNVARLVVLGAAIYFLLLAWDLNVSAWIASAGIMGLALGLAAQETLANFFGGFSIIMDAPYKIGDYVHLDAGERGRVTKIGLRSTRILTRDDIEITVPNARIANSKIVNESGGPNQKMRVTALVGVAYGSDVDHVREVLLRAAKSVDHVVDEPAPRIRFTEMADSALVFRVLCWIDRPEWRGLCLDGINTAIYKALAAEGITIPFPQRDVHLRQVATPAR
jgi:small-conductance mechanosensitive channel